MKMVEGWKEVRKTSGITLVDDNFRCSYFLFNAGCCIVSLDDG